MEISDGRQWVLRRSEETSAMVPVPGDGRYEWDGYLPIKAKPTI